MIINFIVNLHAGGGQCEKKFSHILGQLKRKNQQYRCIYTNFKGHATIIANELVKKKVDNIVAVGGDGTVREVAKGLLGTHIPLGILPLGTGNDFFRSLHVSSNIDELLYLWENRTTQVIDAVEINGDVFLNVAGLGFDVDILQCLAKYKKVSRGIIPFLLGIGEMIRRATLRAITINFDEEEIDLNVLLLTIGNGSYFAGGMKILPEASLSDGKMDVCIFQDVKGTRNILYHLFFILVGKHLTSKNVHYKKCTTMYINGDQSIQVEIDGDITTHLPASLHIIPQALTIFGKQKGDS